MSEVAKILLKDINEHAAAFRSLATKQLPARMAFKLAVFSRRLSECAQVITEVYERIFKEHSEGAETMAVVSDQHRAFSEEFKAFLKDASDLAVCEVRQEEILAACEARDVTLSTAEAACIDCFFAQ